MQMDETRRPMTGARWSIAKLNLAKFQICIQWARVKASSNWNYSIFSAPNMAHRSRETSRREPNVFAMAGCGCGYLDDLMFAKRCNRFRVDYPRVSCKSQIIRINSVHLHTLSCRYCLADSRRLSSRPSSNWNCHFLSSEQICAVDAKNDQLIYVQETSCGF